MYFFSGKLPFITLGVLTLTFGTWATKPELYIGGFFPLSGVSVDSIGQALLPACEMAIDMINNRTDILQDYQLKLIWGDTKCDAGNGIKILYQYLERSTPVIMLLGAACSSVTKVVAEAAWHWNLLQVSYASTASELSNKAKYPLLYRAISPDSAYNTARVNFLEFYQWRRVATLRQDGFAFTQVMSELHESLAQNNMTLIASESFTDDPRSQIKALKEKDARIIVGMFYEDRARQVFCEAYKQGMYGAKYVWLLLDWANDHEWWRTQDTTVSCTAREIARAVSGYFSVDSVSLMDSDKTGISGMTSQEFMAEFRRSHGNRTNVYVPFAFDSVWMIALALDRAAVRMRGQNKTLDQFTYADDEMKDVLQSAMESVTFPGVTGPIELTSQGKRRRPVGINQLQGGRHVTIAIYNPSTGKITQNATAPVLWQGAGPPFDGQRTIYAVEYIAEPLFWVVVVLATLGILLALGFLCFNFRYRHHSYIKLSSPNLNNVIILGAVLIFMSVYLIILDGRTIKPAGLPHVCAATAYLLGIGYSLAVGAMFSKTWRVHQIFNKVKPKKKVFTDRELIGLVVLLVIVDILVISLWVGVDPLRYGLHVAGERTRNSDVIIIQQYEYCHSKYTTTWLYLIMGYKGLILLVGCFIAWETRKVKVRALNDSRFVGLSVYNIVLAVAIGGPLTFLIGDDRNAFVAIYSFFVFFPTSISLCLLFVPKIIKIRKHPEEFLRLQSLSAMRMGSEYGSGSNYSSSTDHVTIVRLQIELAQAKRELEELKTNSEGKGVKRIGSDHQYGGKHERPSRRSQTYLDLSQLQQTSPDSTPYRRCNTFSGAVHAAALDGSYLGEGRKTISLKAENEELRRELKESKINEAGKMCKILYKNAELNRKLVELSMKQRSGSTEEDDTVTRLMRENTELKRQLGEVSILNSVWCDVTPRLSRKARQDSKGRDDIKELNKLLTVDLGGAGRNSFGPSRLNRPPPIGKSQSSLDLLDSKDDEVTGSDVEESRDEQNIKIVVENDKTKLMKNDEYDSKSGVTAMEKVKNSNAGKGKRKASYETKNKEVERKRAPLSDFISQLDNEGFVDDEIGNQKSDFVDSSRKSSKSNLNYLHGKWDTDIAPAQTNNALFTPDEKRDHSVPVLDAKNLYKPRTRGQIGSEASDSGLDSAPVSPQPLVIRDEDMHQTAESSFSRRRQKSKKDKKTRIERVEKTFFV